MKIYSPVIMVYVKFINDNYKTMFSVRDSSIDRMAN